jgi:16S rRNA (cytosine1402-N4)-methyltransferase
VIDETTKNLGGVLIDLGGHMTQAEERSRGFSFVDDGPLDLRLNPDYGVPASEWLLTASVQELAWVIHEHGEDNDIIMAMRLAEGILERQHRLGPYKSSLELADVCREVKLGVDDRGQHPAKLTFQALRTFLNHEVEQLDAALRGAMLRLQPGGRCVIITYRRKQATQVKNFIRENEEADSRFAGFVTEQRLAELYPLLATDHPWSCRQSCEPLRPSQQDCERIPWARPASVHILTKEARDFNKSPCRGIRPRSEAEQFKRPTPLPFQGAAAPETDHPRTTTGHEVSVN